MNLDIALCTFFTNIWPLYSAYNGDIRFYLYYSSLLEFEAFLGGIIRTTMDLFF